MNCCSCWLVITLVGSASLQDINPILDKKSPAKKYAFQEKDALNPASQNINFFNLPTEDMDGYPPVITDDHSEFYKQDEEQLKRRKRTIVEEPYQEMNTLEEVRPYIDLPFDKNEIENKRNFSPWGGKRDVDDNWLSKPKQFRTDDLPKRVRFSPWGGKRNVQILRTNNLNGPVFPSNMTDLVRSFMFNHFSEFNSIMFKPSVYKKQAIDILARNSLTKRGFLPFENSVSDNKVFRIGNPFTNINWKKDGKPKMKFSVWGGKRSSPIIGPIIRMQKPTK